MIRQWRSSSLASGSSNGLPRCWLHAEKCSKAYLFGSCARGKAQPHSDIDVAVYVDETLADDGNFGYRAKLTTVLMAGLGYNDVDVVVLNRAPPLLYHRVLRDGVRVLSRDLPATTTREGRALSRYCDFLPQLAKMEAARRFAENRGKQ